MYSLLVEMTAKAFIALFLQNFLRRVVKAFVVSCAVAQTSKTLTNCDEDDANTDDNMIKRSDEEFEDLLNIDTVFGQEMHRRRRSTNDIDKERHRRRKNLKKCKACRRRDSVRLRRLQRKQLNAKSPKNFTI